MINLLIVGAGSAGKMIAEEIINKYRNKQKYNICGFIDDDINKKNLLGFPVLGQTKDIPQIVKDYNIDEIIIAIPSAGEGFYKKIIDITFGIPVKIRIVPGLYEIIEGRVHLNQIRDFEPEDLLGREEVGFNKNELEIFFKDKKIFITGGGGSIGSEILNQLLSLDIKKIVAFGHGENSIHSLILRFKNDNRFDYIIGDIRDYDKLDYELSRERYDILYHAAAHKHLPLMERYPEEAIKNNIIGTYNTIKAAINNNIERFIFISTDKAVNPISIMGATKRVCEKIVLSFNKLNKTKFSVVRFGNVLGSRGSVIPVFIEQIKRGGPITITHPEMTRYFMTIREASKLVIKSSTLESGHIYILDMGKPVKIYDFAKQMLKFYGYTENEIPIVFTGIRKGEKLNEELFTEYEKINKTIYDKLFISEFKEDYLTIDDIEKLINDFSNAVKCHNTEQIINLLKKYGDYKGENGCKE